MIINYVYAILIPIDDGGNENTKLFKKLPTINYMFIIVKSHVYCLIKVSLYAIIIKTELDLLQFYFKRE